MITPRIGFCCKWIDGPSQIDGIKQTDTAAEYNTGTTTITWLNRQTKAVAEERLWQLMERNIKATTKLVEKVGELPNALRMVRISSDLLPAYTERSWSYFWRQADVRAFAAMGFARIGQIARDRNIRLSFHPGQFCVLASNNDDVVTRSIEEFEYHVDMARWMGYGREWHDHGFKINVHIAGRLGPAGIVAALSRLSPEARNLITIENEENAWGLDDCLSIGRDVAIVLDVHHHWVNTGEYIVANDDRVKQVESSWRGVRPTLHYSCSREDILGPHDPVVMPDMFALLENGYKKQKLRAHSNFMWNQAVNMYVSEFWDNFDIQVESKGKNLASFALYEELCSNKLNS
jgi:UV DNA damage repair endonuclease